MELNKKYTVKNSTGIMTIMPIDIIRDDIGNADYSLGDFNTLRVEFYENEFMSLYSHYENKDNIIYFIQIPTFQNDSCVTYKCKIVESEKKEYDFTRIEVDK